MTSDTATLPAEGRTGAHHVVPRPGTRCALRPVIVPASLEALHGPVAGLVALPQRLFWSGADRVFDLSDLDCLAEMYEAVFDAARTEADLAEYVNGEVLARLWSGLALAPRVRRSWEGAHPELACAELSDAAPAGLAAV